MLGYAFLALLPTIAGILLHIGYNIVLVNDLKAKNGFDDILQRNDSLETTILVNHQGNLTLLLKHGIKDVGDRRVFVEIRKSALYISQLGVEMVFCQILEGIVAKHITRDELLRVCIDGYTREVVVRIAVVVLA